MGYYNRAVNADDTVQPLQDSSSNILFALGVVDPASQRAERHVAALLAALSRDGGGLARYAGDDYYYTSRWSPAGDEAHGLDPAWPQMSMWVAAFEILRGRRADALARMQWFVGTLGRGYMPHSEALSYATRGPVESSMSEPLTASSYLLVALLYQGSYDLCIVPPIQNAGAWKPMAIAPAAAKGPASWSDVPYFLAPRADGAPPSPGTTIARVYAANDDANLYLRVDNLAGSLPAFRVEPCFALRVYSGDFGGGGAPTTNAAIEAGTLARPAAFAVERRSDSDDFTRWRVRQGQWALDGRIDGVLAPQWDPASGRVEAVIPLFAFAGAAPLPGSAWAALTVELARHDPATDAWIGDGRVVLHYRWSSSADAWIYGNIEQ